MSNLISKAIKTVKKWWVFAALGAFMIICSFWMLTEPGSSFTALSAAFCIAILAYGISNAVFAITNRKYINGWGWMLTGGLFEIIMGLVLVFHPVLSELTLLIFAGLWVSFRGVQLIGLSIDLKEVGMQNWVWSLLFGIIITLIGTLMVFQPAYSFLNVIFLCFLGFFTTGLGYLTFAYDLKKIKIHTVDRVEAIMDEIEREIKALTGEATA